MQYDTFNMYRSKQCGGQDSVSRTHCPVETCRRQQKLKINLENCAILWFVLYCHVYVKRRLFVNTLLGDVKFIKCIVY
jgi:hypothetical protein